eukprot:gene5738-5801_t
MVGAYLLVVCFNVLGLPYLLSMGISVILMAGFGVLFAGATYWPLRHRGGLPVIISTIGASIFLENIVLVLYGPSPEVLPGLFDSPGIQVGPVFMDSQYLSILVSATLLVILQYVIFEKTLLGKKLQATSQDKEMASLLGIPVAVMILITFAYSAALGMSNVNLASARVWRGAPQTVAACVAVVALAFIAPAEGYYLNILMQAATYAIAVSGLVVVLGYCGQISIAQAAFFGIGAYGVAIGTVDFGLGFFPALLMGVAAAGLLGLILGLGSLRLGGHYLAMVTISFQQIMTLFATNWITFTHGPDGIRDIPRPSFAGISFANGHAFLALCLVCLVFSTLVIWRLKTGRLGRAMQAVRDNELAAGTCGINVFGTKVIAFGISAVMGGIGGGLFAAGFQYISPDQFTFGESIVLLTMALLGGVQSPSILPSMARPSS